MQAQLSIHQAAALVRQRPQGELIRDLEIAGDSVTAAVPTDSGQVKAIGLAIDRVARVGFGRPLCLVRSLALQNLFLKRGITGSRIRVGVRMKDGSFEAHAWVEWNGTVVGEDPAYVELFRAFSELQSRQTDVSLITPA